MKTVNYSESSVQFENLKPYTYYVANVSIEVKDFPREFSFAWNRTNTASLFTIKSITCINLFEQMKVNFLILIDPEKLQNFTADQVNEQKCTQVKLKVAWTSVKMEDIHGEFKSINISLMRKNGSVLNEIHRKAVYL